MRILTRNESLFSGFFMSTAIRNVINPGRRFQIEVYRQDDWGRDTIRGFSSKEEAIGVAVLLNERTGEVSRVIDQLEEDEIVWSCEKPFLHQPWFVFIRWAALAIPTAIMLMFFGYGLGVSHRPEPHPALKTGVSVPAGSLESVSEPPSIDDSK